MNKGRLLFWTAVFIGLGVHDSNAGNYGASTFEFIIGIGIAFNLICKFMEGEE